MSKKVPILIARHFFTLVILSLTYHLNLAQSQSFKIDGKIIDETEQGLPFATVYIENTTRGTTSNVNGDFVLESNTDEINMVIQFVGYKKKIVRVTRENSTGLTIRMEPEIIQLKEFVVSSNGEDPAYAVIRKAIARRKVYQEEINAFQCDTYLKGLQAITQKPEKILGFTVPVDSGIIYLSESVSRFYYRRPDKIKEEMISSKVSGNNNTFSYNIASDVLFNPYQNIFEYQSISERGFISPIASNALMFYDYELQGTFVENGLLINKIEVKPKRSNDPVFSGIIYIIEDQWRIHSVDLLLTKENQIEFIDSIKIKQVYAPVPDKYVWTLLSQRFEFTLEAFGFKGFGYFIGVYSNYKVEPNYRSLQRDRGIIVAAEDQTFLFEDKRKFFDNEILKIKEGANKRDSTYWKQTRPVPLTSVEKRDYIKGDSLNSIRQTRAYKDSIDRIRNRPGFMNLLVAGYVHSNSYKRMYLRFQPLSRILLYNTVEGAVINLRATYCKRNEKGINHQIVPTIRYGFGNNQMTAHLSAYYHNDLTKFERFGISGGRQIMQINEREPIRPETNTFQTLVYRRNYIKLYEKAFFRPSYRRELANGIMLNASLEYADRRPMENTSFYTLFFTAEERPFTSNNPRNIAVGNQTGFERHQAIISNVSLRFRFNQKYITRPGRKIIQFSPSPELTLNYQKGINAFGSDVNFDWLEAKIANTTSFGLLGNSDYSVSVGKFLNNSSLFFPDFYHFIGNRSTMTVFGPDVLQLLSYYNFSTNDRKIEIHYEHHFNGFIVNKLPYIRKSKIQTVFSFNFADTPVAGSYYEFGMSFEHILKIARIGYFVGYQERQKAGAGMRIGFGF